MAILLSIRLLRPRSVLRRVFAWLPTRWTRLEFRHPTSPSSGRLCAPPWLGRTLPPRCTLLRSASSTRCAACATTRRHLSAISSSEPLDSRPPSSDIEDCRLTLRGPSFFTLRRYGCRFPRSSFIIFISSDLFFLRSPPAFSLISSSCLRRPHSCIVTFILTECLPPSLFADPKRMSDPRAPCRGMSNANGY